MIGINPLRLGGLQLCIQNSALFLPGSPSHIHKYPQEKKNKSRDGKYEISD